MMDPKDREMLVRIDERVGTIVDAFARHQTEDDKKHELLHKRASEAKDLAHKANARLNWYGGGLATLLAVSGGVFAFFRKMSGA